MVPGLSAVICSVHTHIIKEARNYRTRYACTYILRTTEYCSFGNSIATGGPTRKVLFHAASRNVTLDGIRRSTAFKRPLRHSRLLGRKSHTIPLLLLRSEIASPESPETPILCMPHGMRLEVYEDSYGTCICTYNLVYSLWPNEPRKIVYGTRIRQADTTSNQVLWFQYSICRPGKTRKTQETPGKTGMFEATPISNNHDLI